MNRFYLLFLLLAVSVSSTFAQIRIPGYAESKINPDLLKPDRWEARWISMPDEPQNVYGIYHFRKEIDLSSVPEEFIVHVTADNRYKLYVNGEFVSLGPTRGDIYNWNFETVDIAPYLHAGKNVLAAVVWNYAEMAPQAQVSFHQTGFLLQGNTDAESIVNTDASWSVCKNLAYSPSTGGQVIGYFVVGPGETVDANSYPWGWQTENPGTVNAHWKSAKAGIEGAAKGARDYPGRLLVPTPIPPMEMKMERFKRIRQTDLANIPAGFPLEGRDVTIPAREKVQLLLDNDQLTTGYLNVCFSKGRNAEITIGYAEALFEGGPDAKPGKYGQRNKGHRDEVEGKTFIGFQDKIIADGADNRLVTSLWWRTWRYVQVTIETQDEPLIIEDIYGTLSAYPFEPAYSFSAPGHEELNQMLDIGWQTARLCANETYMDCPYYEQLQYFGDTRIQAMITLYNTRDPYMVKNAIEQGRQSIIADGITMSRYPSALYQLIPSFSLWWICMAHDYWMLRGDGEYIRSLLPAHRGILAWYFQWLKPDFSLDYIPHWFFADWADGFTDGEPVREKNGNSAFQDLQYLLALDLAAEMEAAYGVGAMSWHYETIAEAIRKNFRDKYWDSTKGLFADTYDRRSFSQHVNAMAILAGIVDGEEAKEVMTRTLSDPDLIQATIYFRYYVHQALAKAGLGDRLIDNLSIWKDQMALGLTTWAEMPEPTRSDCHAWGASPNIEFFRIILGIRSDCPGFRQIWIEPSLGDLKEVSGTMPHPDGEITVSYEITSNGKLKARFSLPRGTDGTFCWKGEEYSLRAGEQVLEL